MNDAHSPRQNPAGGSGGQQRPDGGWDPYGPYPPPPHGAQDTGGAQDVYPGAYDPYPGQYSGGTYQGGYGYDPAYDPASAPAPPDGGYGTGTQPHVPQQGDYPGYGSGQGGPGQGYSAGQGYGTGTYETGTYDTGAYGTGAHAPQAYQPGGYGTGTYAPGSEGTGPYDTGPYDTGTYQTGTYDTGQYPAAGQTAGTYGTTSAPTGPRHTPGPGQQSTAARPDAAGRGTQPRSAPFGNPYDELAELAGPDDGSSTGQGAAGTRSGRAPEEPDYRTEQFAFVDDEPEDEEVIDWLKFAETRTERRDERKRRTRNRVVALLVVLALGLVGGVGYLWQQGRLPFLGGDRSAAASAEGQKRDVIVVHLKELDSENSSTALLVDNQTTGRGATVLLPNALAVSTDDAGSTTLGKSVDEAGAGPTRDSLSVLLGADIKGTWRLDTPFLEVLVESVGGIQVKTDTEVRGTGKDKNKVLVPKGEKQQLRGAAAVAYATHRALGEASGKQLARFGQVLEAVLKKIPGDAASATSTVQSLGSVPDPSLPEEELGASLAPLAEHAKTGEYRTVTLPVRADGTLDEENTGGVVRDILGGTVKNTDPGATPRVSVQDASGSAGAAQNAQITLVNSGYTFVSAGRADGVAVTSRVEYSDPAAKQTAQEVAQTLGLPASAVAKVSGGAQNAQVRVVLGKDFRG